MPQTHFFHAFMIFWSAKKMMQRHFFPPSIPFPGYFLQLQQQWQMHCFSILGSTSIVIHSVKQHLLRNQTGSDSCDLLWLLAWKIAKGIHSCKPASLNRPIGKLGKRHVRLTGLVSVIFSVLFFFFKVIICSFIKFWVHSAIFCMTFCHWLICLCKSDGKCFKSVFSCTVYLVSQWGFMHPWILLKMIISLPPD